MNLTNSKRLKLMTLPLIVAIMMFFAGCSSTKTLQNPVTNATLWMQNSAEYKALTHSVYQTAASKLDSALFHSSWTAYSPQRKASYRDLPPAIVVDVDETVLDNSPFEARLIKNKASYSSDKWNAWVHEEKADAIPGAVDFLRYAARRGVTVFYVTNRDSSLTKATRRNLQKQGFPLTSDAPVVLTNHGQSNWTSSKENRRKFIAQRYRIILFFGDNLNDFLPAQNISHQKRLQLVEDHHKLFGQKWFILPNPVYGSWQNALYDFDNSLNKKQRLERKINMLNTKN